MMEKLALSPIGGWESAVSTDLQDALERFQPGWKRSNSNFASNFIDLTSLRDFQST